MTRDEARDYIHEHGTEILERDKSGKGWICPICESGRGAHGTGITSKDGGKHFTCWAGCFTNCDIIDIIGQIENISEYPAKLEAAARRFGITIDGNNSPTPIVRGAKKTGGGKGKDTTKEVAAMTVEDIQFFLLEAEKHLEDTDYYRGISLETLRRFHVGYCPAWRHPKAPQTVPTSPRLIIPTSAQSYLARDTRSNLDERQEEYKKQLVGSRGKSLFNGDALKAATGPVFFAEGEIDAMSIIDVGGEAVTAGSAGNWQWIVDALKEQRPAYPVIVAFDNDGVGGKDGLKLKTALGKEGIAFVVYTPPNEAKDANEALMKDRASFAASVQDAIKLAFSLQAKLESNAIQALDLLEDVALQSEKLDTVQEPGLVRDEEEYAQKDAYLSTSTTHYLQSFIDGIADSVNTPYIPTGFRKLDDVLDGGLYEGLYVVGGISSLGKTTFIMQIADQIAQTRQDVLIFSLEMARTEIMAKSISRHTLQQVLNTGGDFRNAKTTRGITTGKRYENYNKTEHELIKGAIVAYGEYAKHIYISEGIGAIGVEQIRKTMRQHIHFTGVTPVVIIDYLQILAPYNDRATDKQNTDKAVMELKRISRDYKTPVIGISSFNRANYRVEVAMEAFKESGAIEYSSDVLIGLQLKGAGETKFNVNAAKRKNPREIELVILKNRNGRTGDKLGYKYYAPFNYFAEG